MGGVLSEWVNVGSDRRAKTQANPWIRRGFSWANRRVLGEMSSRGTGS